MEFGSCHRNSRSGPGVSVIVAGLGRDLAGGAVGEGLGDVGDVACPGPRSGVEQLRQPGQPADAVIAVGGPARRPVDVRAAAAGLVIDGRNLAAFRTRAVAN